MTSQTVVRPVLRYHGGKFLLAPWVASHLPAHRTYVEPFGGAASVLMHKPPSRAEVYNDLDGEVVSLFRVLRDPAQVRELRRLLEHTPYARAEFEAAYRADVPDPIEAARRLVVRCFMGIGTNAGTQGVGRPHTGWRNHVEPNGSLRAKSWAELPSHLDVFTRRLRGIVIDQSPALRVLEHYDTPETLFYCDPPYPKEARSDLRDDYRFEMSDMEHRELAAALNELEGMALLSGYACSLYEELFAGWQRVERAAITHQGRARTEVLWFNAKAWQRLQGHEGLFAICEKEL